MKKTIITFLNVVQHAFLIKKGTMKYSLVIIFAMSLLAACSNNDEITETPDHPHMYLNTGKLLSMDGGNEHLAFPTTQREGSPLQNELIPGRSL